MFVQKSALLRAPQWSGRWTPPPDPADPADSFSREVKTGTPSTGRYPNFEEIVVLHVADTMKRCGYRGELLPREELVEMNAMWAAGMADRKKFLKKLIEVKQYVSHCAMSLRKESLSFFYQY